ncbi:hypothetical protein AB4Y36_10175 [Paraburkholderia sp. BR10936]
MYKGLSPGKGFQNKGGGLKQSGFKRKHAGGAVFIDEAGEAHALDHQDPHGVYRDVDADAVRGGVRVFNPGDVDEHGEPLPAPTRAKRITFKRSRPKQPKGNDARYLAACRGEQCYLRLPGCMARGFEHESVVPAHRNEGKGMGLKVPDEFTVPACYACHMEFDQGMRYPRERKRALWNAAYAVWEQVRMHKLGLADKPEFVTI